MTNVFGEHITHATEVPQRKFQGRSQKKLRTVITHDGRVWIARYEGRPGRFFGSTSNEANNNLQTGGAA